MYKYLLEYSRGFTYPLSHSFSMWFDSIEDACNYIDKEFNFEGKDGFIRNVRERGEGAYFWIEPEADFSSSIGVTRLKKG